MSHFEDEIDDLLADFGSSDRLAAFGVVPFLCDQLSVPTEDRVGREQGADLLKPLASENLSLAC